MKKFLFRGLLYSLPLMVAIMSVWFIDPYSLFWSKREFDQKKFDIGYSYDQGRRFKLFTFKNNPKEKIVLGASEINVLNERTIPEAGWHSLSFGGAPLQESLQLFWEIADNYHLTDVILAPEFIKYYLAISKNKEQYYSSFNWNTSQSAEALKIYDNKLNYFIDKYTLESTWGTVMSAFTGGAKRGKPNNREEFWKSQLDYAISTFDCQVDTAMRNGVHGQFREIKKYADRHGVEIKIVLPIQHTDLIEKEYTEPTFTVYKDYIKMLVNIFGKVYYFDYPSELSQKTEMFGDPFHYKESDIYTKSLWSNEKYCIELDKENVENVLSKNKKEI